MKQKSLRYHLILLTGQVIMKRIHVGDLNLVLILFELEIRCKNFYSLKDDFEELVSASQIEQTGKVVKLSLHIYYY